MKTTRQPIAGLAIALIVFAAPAAAQDEGSMQVGNAKVSIGAGTAILTLPDVDSFLTLRGPVGNAPFLNSFKFSDDSGDEIGWNVNASIEAPIGVGKTLSLNGFWANIDDKDSARCDDNSPTIQCFTNSLVDAPGVQNRIGTLNGESIVSSAERDVDQWGVSLEAKW